MSLWHWRELANACGVSDGRAAQAPGAKAPGQAGPGVTGISIDSRSILPGDLFVALTGKVPLPFNTVGSGDHDGHNFVDSARAGGAAGVVVERPVQGGPTLLVPSTFEALWAIARAARTRLASEARVVALTGSSGKTTLRHMLAHIVSPHFRTHASTGSLNNHWGLPLSLARMPRETEVGIFEIGMNHPGELAPLAQLARPHIAVVLNVLPVHVEHFPDGIDGITREKLSIAGGLEPRGVLFVPGHLQGAARRVAPDVDCLPVSGQVAGPVELGSIDTNGHFEVRAHGQQATVRLPLVGEHIRQTALVALGIAVHMGIAIDAAAGALATLEALPGRGALSTAAGVLIVDDSYNANPDSMRHAIAALLSRPGRRHVAILGEMHELGPSGDYLHAAVGDATADLDGVVSVGPGFQHVKIKGPHWAHFDDVADINVDEMASRLIEGDCVLIKGSNRVFWTNRFAGRLRAALEARDSNSAD